jgi:hypothetical protein
LRNFLAGDPIEKKKKERKFEDHWYLSEYLSCVSMGIKILEKLVSTTLSFHPNESSI